MAQEPSEIREEIEGTREQLADTVQRLVEKADVKTRARESVSDNVSQLQNRASEVTDKVREVAPEKAKAGVSLVAGRAQQQPWLVAVAVGSLLMFFIVSRRIRAKNR